MTRIGSNPDFQNRPLLGTVPREIHGMSQFMIPLPPDHGRIRIFFHRHTQTIISHPVCAWFFAGCIACCLGVWFSSGEMFIVVPVLILGWVFASIAWWWAPNLSTLAKICLVAFSAIPLFAEGVILYRHVHGQPEMADTAKQPPIDLTKNEGVLEPGTMPDPPGMGQIPEGALAIFAGGGVCWTQGASVKIVKMAGDDMLTIERRGPSLVVTVLRIYDANGSIIARIDEDGFWVAPQVRKKRPDKSTLIVFDQSDVEVLNLRFLNPKSISVRAFLRHPKKPLASVSITDEYIRYMPNNLVVSGVSLGAVGGGATVFNF